MTTSASGCGPHRRRTRHWPRGSGYRNGVPLADRVPGDQPAFLRPAGEPVDRGDLAPPGRPLDAGSELVVAAPSLIGGTVVRMA